MPSNRRWTLQRYTACLPRRYEIIMHWFRIGHTYMTHGYLLKSDSPPQCNVCQKNTQLSAYCCIVRHECNSCEYFTLAASHACSVELIHVASLILSKKFVFIAKLDSNISFSALFYSKMCVLLASHYFIIISDTVRPITELSFFT